MPKDGLPVADAAYRLISVAGVGDFGGTDHYRYIVLAGARDESAGSFMRTEVAALRSHHWKLKNSTRFVGPEAATKSVPIGASGALVELDGRINHEYAVISSARSVADADQQIQASPLASHGREIRGALRAHRPVLIVTCAQHS